MSLKSSSLIPRTHHQRPSPPTDTATMSNANGVPFPPTGKFIASVRTSCEQSTRKANIEVSSPRESSLSPVHDLPRSLPIPFSRPHRYLPRPSLPSSSPSPNRSTPACRPSTAPPRSRSTSPRRSTNSTSSPSSPSSTLAPPSALPCTPSTNAACTIPFGSSSSDASSPRRTGPTCWAQRR